MVGEEAERVHAAALTRVDADAADPNVIYVDAEVYVTTKFLRRTPPRNPKTQSHTCRGSTTI